MQTDNRASGPSQKDLSQTLARGLKLLDLIAEGREGVAVRELAEAMKLPRTIVQRLLYTLEAEGFLERHPTLGGYRLTIKLWSHGCTAIRRLNVRDVARPIMQDLASKSDEMVKLGVLDGHEIVYVEGIDSPQAVRAYVPIGGRAPVHSIATGKAILAFLPAEKLAEIGLTSKRYTKNTVVGSDAFVKELEQIRKRGYAVNHGEWSDDVGGVAAPVFDAQGHAIGSLGIILPMNRFTPAKALQLGSWATAAASAISAKLGYRAADDRSTIKRVG
jgi:IclR family KDG regulon transcriptional repressor